MDENKNVNDEIDYSDLEIDEEEIKRVEEMLKSSKSKRKKMTTSNKENKNDKPTIIDICKKNPVIPITMILAITLIIGGIIYFVNASKNKPVNTLGISYEQLVANYKNTDLYNDLFKDFDTELPELTYMQTSEESNEKLNYFGTNVSQHGFTPYSIAIQGAESKENKNLVSLRVMYQVPTTQEDLDDNIQSLFLYFSMIMNSVYPDISSEDINAMLASTSSTNQYEIKNNIAYRFSIQKADSISFYALDFIPAADLDKLEDQAK